MAKAKRSKVDQIVQEVALITSAPHNGSYTSVEAAREVEKSGSASSYRQFIAVVIYQLHLDDERITCNELKAMYGWETKHSNISARLNQLEEHALICRAGAKRDGGLLYEWGGETDWRACFPHRKDKWILEKEAKQRYYRQERMVRTGGI